MSEITLSSMPVFNECTSIEIGGTKIPASIRGEVHFTYAFYPAQNMSGRMEDAIPADEEVALEEVELIVTIWDTPFGGDEEHCIKFISTCTEFYEEHFGVLDCEDVIGYT